MIELKTRGSNEKGKAAQRAMYARNFAEVRRRWAASNPPYIDPLDVDGPAVFRITKVTEGCFRPFRILDDPSRPIPIDYTGSSRDRLISYLNRACIGRDVVIIG